jgi:hypothetical protein
MRWQSLTDITVACPKEPAAYIITLPSRGRIPRFIDADKDCIITIGSTVNMNRRRKQFEKGLNTLEGHSAGNLFNLINKACGLQITAMSFRIDYILQNSAQDAFNVESELTAEYMVMFGEAPPFNSVIPKRKDAAFWNTKVESMLRNPVGHAGLQEWQLQRGQRNP